MGGGRVGQQMVDGQLVDGTDLHSSTFQLNLSRFRHKIHPRHPLESPDTS